MATDTQTTTAPSSPNLTQQDGLNDVPEDDMMGDMAMGLSGSFKQQAFKNSKGKSFWETFSESSSTGGARTTPPPVALLPRGSSSGISEDVMMDSPSVGNTVSSRPRTCYFEVPSNIADRNRMALNHRAPQKSHVASITSVGVKTILIHLASSAELSAQA